MRQQGKIAGGRRYIKTKVPVTDEILSSNPRP